MSEVEAVSSVHDKSRSHRTFARTGMGLLLLMAAAATLAAPLTLEIGTLAAPKPGFWMFWVALATVILTAVTLVRIPILEDGVDPLRKQDRPVLFAIPLLLLMVPMLTLFGVSITTLFVSLYWFKVLAHASWRMTLIGSVLITAGVWTVFIYLLGVPFTPGTLIPI